jgi:hypothetical protein
MRAEGAEGAERAEGPEVTRQRATSSSEHKSPRLHKLEAIAFTPRHMPAR